METYGIMLTQAFIEVADFFVAIVVTNNKQGKPKTQEQYRL